MSAVAFPVSCEVAYDYLVDPAHRAEWQSSLRGVDEVTGDTGVVGQHWRDLTAAGAKPLMELTEAERPHRWSESGSWRGLHAVLTLTFVPAPDDIVARCEVGVSMRVAGRGLVTLAARVLDRVAPYAVRSDLERAARILGSR